MSAVTPIETPASFPAEPDISELFARTVEAPLPTVAAAAARIDLIGPLVEGLIAVGVGKHIVTPCSNGLVWRFDAVEGGLARIVWSIETEAETDDASLLTLAVRASASDETSRERLLEAWPVLGPVVEFHARRILHAVEALAEEAEDDPFDAPRKPHLSVVS